jgi:hypothetical protein
MAGVELANDPGTGVSNAACVRDFEAHMPDRRKPNLAAEITITRQ